MGTRWNRRRRGGSNEYPQYMFLSRNKKNNVYPCKPQFYWIKVCVCVCVCVCVFERGGGQNYIGVFSWCVGCLNGFVTGTESVNAVLESVCNQANISSPAKLAYRFDRLNTYNYTFTVFRGERLAVSRGMQFWNYYSELRVQYVILYE